MAKWGSAPPSLQLPLQRGLQGKSRAAEQFVYICFLPSIFSWVLAGEMKHIHGWEKTLPLLSLSPGCKNDVFDNVLRPLPCSCKPLSRTMGQRGGCSFSLLGGERQELAIPHSLHGAVR